MTNKEEDELFLRKIAIRLNLFGYLALLAMVSLGWHPAVGMVSSLMGATACIVAVAVKSVKLVVSSVFLAIGFFLALLLFYYLESLSKATPSVLSQWLQ